MENQKNNITIKKKDFIEIKFTGYANNEIFDSNVEEDLRKINPKSDTERLIIVVGENMVVKGFDKELENKEINKEYSVNIPASEAFGIRAKTLIRTIPLKSFTQKKINPKTGMLLALDNQIVKIIAVSGARVIADFNNPLAGKEIKYKFKIVRKLDSEKEKIEFLLKLYFGKIPEIDIKDKIIIKEIKNFEPMIKIYNQKFKDLLNKELSFEEL